jgi:predicted esterase
MLRRYTETMNNTLKKLSITTALWLSLFLLSACVTLTSSEHRDDTANQLAANHNWQAELIQTSHFDLISYQPEQDAKETLLTVYIEGDGLAWVTKNTVSTDPTPINPTGLKLAINHTQGNAVYLARPCQYTGGSEARNCTKHDWTDSRFSEQVIASTNEAISTLKTEFGAEQLQLVGYSGGGAVAALVTARRSDVIKLITVAGNLDHQAWTTFHHISPLSNSLNPAEYQKQLANIKQVHFVGANDNVIPPFLAQQFVAGFDNQTQADVVIVPNQEHNCCWDKIWTDLMEQVQLP